MSLPPQRVHESEDGPSFVRRLALGLIVLLGLYFGLLHVSSAISLHTSESAVISIEGTFGLVVAATLVSATVAGTVNRYAAVAGFLLGLGAAAAFIGIQMRDGFFPDDEWWIGVILMLVMVGVVGSVAGQLVIPPSPRLPRLDQFDKREVAVPVRRIKIIWWRVALGAGVAIVATMFADAIRQALSQVLAGNSGSFGLGRLITWQISTLGAVLGGVVAGASTRTGFRQGLLAAIVATMGGIVVLMRANQSLVVEFWLAQLNLKEVGPYLLTVAGGTIFAATTLGGWLGGQVLPPVRRR